MLNTIIHSFLHNFNEKFYSEKWNIGMFVYNSYIEKFSNSYKACKIQYNSRHNEILHPSIL